MVKTILIFFLLSLISNVAFAGDVPTPAKKKILTLEEAIETALKQNPKVIIAKAKKEEAQADVQISQSPFWPRLNLSAMDSFGLGGSSSAIGITGMVNSPYRKGYGTGVDASWLIYDFGQTSYKVKAAKEEASAQEEDFLQSLAEMKLAVVRSYMGCVFFRELTLEFQEREDRQLALIKEIEKYVQSGLNSPLELNLAKASLEQTHSLQANAQGMLTQSIEQLKELIGEPDRESFVGEDPWKMIPDADPLAGILDHAIKERPELKAAEKRYHSAQAARKAASFQHSPQLVAVGSTAFLEDVSLTRKRDWSAGIGVKVPFFDGLRTEGEVWKAKERETQACAKVDEWKNRIQQEVTSAYAQWEQAKKSDEALEKQYGLTTEAYRLAIDRYRQKQGTFSEFRDAESSFNQSAQEKLKSEMNYRLSFYQLLIVGAKEIPER